MALSMDEQRILAEIESRLAQEDPKLAERLAGLSRERRRRRIRMIAAIVVAAGVITAIVAAILTALS